MALDLRSVEAKLGRALVHLDAYRRELASWRDRSPYSITKERNADFTRFYLILHVTENPDLSNWTLMIADCVHNLRCALDHLVYAVAVHESGQNPPPNEEQLAFPIASNRANFKSSRRIAALSDRARLAIEAVQPYNRTHPDLPPPLAILRDLSNTDKHRLVRLVFAAPYRGEASLTIPEGRIGVATFYGNHGEVADGSVLMAWHFNRPEPDANIENADLSIAIGLLHEKRDPAGPDWSNRSEASALLTLIANEVRFVVDAVAAEVT